MVTLLFNCKDRVFICIIFLVSKIMYEFEDRRILFKCVNRQDSFKSRMLRNNFQKSDSRDLLNMYVCPSPPSQHENSTVAGKYCLNEEGSLETPNGGWGRSYLQMTRLVLKLHCAFPCVIFIF